MEFDLKDCLFIGVDMQRKFVRSAPDQQETIARIAALRAHITNAGVHSWQVAMLPEPVPDYMLAVVKEREQAKRARDCDPLFEQADGELMFWKSKVRAPTGTAFADILSRRRYKAVFCYGYFLEDCVAATAVFAQKQLPRDSEVVIIRDCGQQSTQGVDLARVCGDKTGLLTSNDIIFADGKLKIAMPLRDRRPEWMRRATPLSQAKL